jgi:hypothetical protein
MSTLAPGRRTFLGHVAGIASAVAIVRVAEAHPDAKLLDLGRLMEKARAEEQVAWDIAAGEDDDDGPLTMQANALYGAVAAVVVQIEQVPATTIDGLLVKMRALDWCRCGDPVTVLDIDPRPDPATDTRIMVGLIQDLTQIGRVA